MSKKCAIEPIAIIPNTNGIDLQVGLKIAMEYTKKNEIEVGFHYNVSTKKLLQDIVIGKSQSITIPETNIDFTQEIGNFHTHAIRCDPFFSMCDLIDITNLTELSLGVIDTNRIYIINLKYIDKVNFYNEYLKIMQTTIEENTLTRLQVQTCELCKSHQNIFKKRKLCNLWLKYEHQIKETSELTIKNTQKFCDQFHILIQYI